MLKEASIMLKLLTSFLSNLGSLMQKKRKGASCQLYNSYIIVLEHYVRLFVYTQSFIQRACLFVTKPFLQQQKRVERTRNLAFVSL